MCSLKDIYYNVSRCTIYNSSKLKITQMLINSRIDKLEYSHNEKLYNNENK